MFQIDGISNLGVHPYSSSCRDGVLSGYKKAFYAVKTPAEICCHLERLEQQLDDGLAVVMCIDDKLVGMGSYLFLKGKDAENPQNLMMRNVRTYLAYSFDRGKFEPKLRDYYIQRALSMGIGTESVVVDFDYDNVFTKGSYLFREDDIALTDIYVNEEQRGNGIGLMLTQERLKIGTENGARAAFTMAVEGCGQHINLERAGFETIFRLGPQNRDGSPLRVMAKLL
jgi:GNAT superfamily N-acetyltransferase